VLSRGHPRNIKEKNNNNVEGGGGGKKIVLTSLGQIFFGPEAHEKDKKAAKGSGGKKLVLVVLLKVGPSPSRARHRKSELFWGRHPVALSRKKKPRGPQCSGLLKGGVGALCGGGGERNSC